MEIATERDFSIRRWSDFLDLDWYILSSVIALTIISLILLKSAANGFYFPKQLTLLLFVSFIGMLVLFIRIKVLESMALWIYFFNILLLLLVLFVGVSIMGAQRWINCGLFSIQPSEIAKIAMIISLAAWFAKYPIKNYLDIMISVLIVIPPFLLIFKQPDIGTSLAFIAIYLGMAFWAGATITHLLLVVSPVLCLILNSISPVIFNFGTIMLNNKVIELTVSKSFSLYILFLLIWLVVNFKPWKSPWIVFSLSIIILLNFIIGFIRPIMWSFLQPYQQRRLTIFLSPESDPLGAGYHIIQSLLAIANGGFFGYGWQQGRLTKGNYVPAQHTDFIFSILGEEFGFVGSMFVIILFVLILWRALHIARNSNDKFASHVAIGIFSFFVFHIFINVGMAIGIMPITGVPLLLLSYGGTALVVNVVAVFLLLSISWRTLPKKIF